MSEDEAPVFSTQKPDVQQSIADGVEEATQFVYHWLKRAQELQATGMSEGQARDTAQLELRISQWPPIYGDDLVVVLYGDFQPPEKPLHFADLGITIESENHRMSISPSATCALTARVTIKEKSVAGLTDAAERINTLLGICSVVNWGTAMGWWSHVTHGILSGGSPVLEQSAIENVINHMKGLQPEVRRKIRAALYWIREPRQLIRDGYRSDVLRVYTGFWNAFECLVDAVCLIWPLTNANKNTKQQQIDRFINAKSDRLTAADIDECYHSIVNPGFVAKASHALKICFPENSEKYITECFKVKPDKDRLYDIRNAINHGDINADDLQELFKVDDKHLRLWMIVFGMLCIFIPINRPHDSKST